MTSIEIIATKAAIIFMFASVAISLFINPFGRRIWLFDYVRDVLAGFVAGCITLLFVVTLYWSINFLFTA
jgi:hypothetical protein